MKPRTRKLKKLLILCDNMIIAFYLGKINEEYIVPTNNTNGEATKGIADNGSLWAEYKCSNSLFLNVRNIVVSFDNSLKRKQESELVNHTHQRRHEKLNQGIEMG